MIFITGPMFSGKRVVAKKLLGCDDAELKKRCVDGKYTVLASLMSQENDMVMFIGSDFTGIHDLPIQVIDAREGGEED